MHGFHHYNGESQMEPHGNRIAEGANFQNDDIMRFASPKIPRFTKYLKKMMMVV